MSACELCGSRHDCDSGCPNNPDRFRCCDDEPCGCFTAETASAVERARVVGVLDAWAASRRGQWNLRSNMLGDAFSCDLVWTEARRRRLRSDLFGPTPDAARAAAAKAIEDGKV